MKKYFGYIRVSTRRQGMEGVSLQEQKSAVETYASRNNLEIVSWYEEQQTAAKRGRRMFVRMLAALERGAADGVVIHKIDRSARNLRDWADLAELIDRGLDVHFAHDALDLRSRGGRLSADIQAVIASDFIRNLREETRKGFYGRLKQGIYPLAAPNGYRDMGRGKPKEPDPVQAPLVRLAFEFYATGEWSFETLQEELNRRGLRSRSGTAISKNGLTSMFNNPFYTGLIHIRKTNETFEGVHQPLITKALYDRVQRVLRGNRSGGIPWKNDFAFRRLIRCGKCGRVLIGERQKQRYIYYRCHTAGCGGASLNERRVDDRFVELLLVLRFDEQEIRDLRDFIEEERRSAVDDVAAREQSIKLQIAQCAERLTRLTDALIDGLIDKSTFDERKTGLLSDKRELLDRLERVASSPQVADVLTRYLELANMAQQNYGSDIPSEKREAVLSTTSNLIGDGNNPVITLRSPFRELVEYRKFGRCDLHRDEGRTHARKIFDIFVDAANDEVSQRDNGHSNQPPLVA
jgi:DNA invertase Pin-like site-specific DNA recombinase